MTNELTKVCPKCGRELPLNEFYKNKTRKDGLQIYCKECQKESDKLYRENHTDDISKYQKEYRENNHSYVLKRAKKYNECVKNPSCPRVGRLGAQFEVFICEICGAEFRRLKNQVDWNYEHRGTLPKYCSKECQFEAMRKTHKSKYAKEIERIKKEVG